MRYLENEIYASKRIFKVVTQSRTYLVYNKSSGTSSSSSPSMIVYTKIIHRSKSLFSPRRKVSLTPTNLNLCRSLYSPQRKVSLTPTKLNQFRSLYIPRRKVSLTPTKLNQFRSLYIPHSFLKNYIFIILVDLYESLSRFFFGTRIQINVS